MARDYEPDRAGLGRLLRTSPELARACLEAAHDHVPRVVADTPRDSGNTAATTHAEPARGSGGRVAAKVVQGGAGVQQQFGNRRTRAQHHLTRGFGNQ